MSQGGVVISNVGSRLDFDIAKKSLADQGVQVEDGKLTQSYLRTEAVLVPGMSSFKFPILVNSANQGMTVSNTCKLLNQQDGFYVTHLGFWIECWKQPNFEPEDLYKFVPYTFPSTALSEIGAVFSTMGYKLWSGEFRLTVSGDVIVPAWDCKRHMNVPQTQREAFAGPWPSGQFYNQHDEFNGSSSSFYPMEPNLVLLGNDGIDWQLQYPEALGNALGDPEQYQIRAVFMMRGLLAQNVSKIAS